MFLVFDRSSHSLFSFEILCVNRGEERRKVLFVWSSAMMNNFQ